MESQTKQILKAVRRRVLIICAPAALMLLSAEFCNMFNIEHGTEISLGVGVVSGVVLMGVVLRGMFR